MLQSLVHALGVAWMALGVANHWFCVHVAPWLMGVAIPSLIAGISKSPSPSAAKWVNALKIAMRVIGFATHKDADGTFKLPFQEVLVALWSWLWGIVGANHSRASACGGQGVLRPF